VTAKPLGWQRTYATDGHWAQQQPHERSGTPPGGPETPMGAGGFEPPASRV